MAADYTGVSGFVCERGRESDWAEEFVIPNRRNRGGGKGGWERWSTERNPLTVGVLVYGGGFLIVLTAPPPFRPRGSADSK